MSPRRGCRGSFVPTARSMVSARAAGRCRSPRRRSCCVGAVPTVGTAAAWGVIRCGCVTAGNRSAAGMPAGGACAFGMPADAPRHGVPPPIGTWGCSVKPTGRRSGSVRRGRTTGRFPPMEPNRPFLPRCCARVSGWHPAARWFSARVYVTGLGYFELYLNGEKVGRDVLAPNQTNYDKRPGLADCGIPVEDNFREYTVPYLAYDVTERLRSGENVIGAMLGNRFLQRAGPVDDGLRLAAADRAVGDCLRRRFAGAGGFRPDLEGGRRPCADGSDLCGRRVRRPLRATGLVRTGFDDSAWQNAVPRRAPYGRLRAQNGRPTA